MSRRASEILFHLAHGTRAVKADLTEDLMLVLELVQQLETRCEQMEIYHDHLRSLEQHNQDLRARLEA